MLDLLKNAIQNLLPDADLLDHDGANALELAITAVLIDCLLYTSPSPRDS